MQLIITENNSLGEVKRKFQSLFPFLKLEFYSEPHQAGQGSPKDFQLDSTKKISEVGSDNNNGVITLSPKTLVKDLEEAFKDIFGLNVQVFRKAGTTWIQTILTDEWTLEKQNSTGEENQRITA
jgi:hypothetical protein